jgi:hypothetical protein
MPSFTGKTKRNEYVRLNGKDPDKVEDGGVPCRSTTTERIRKLAKTLKPGKEKILKEGGIFSGEPNELLIYKSRTGKLFRVMNFKEDRSTWKYFSA